MLNKSVIHRKSKELVHVLLALAEQSEVALNSRGGNQTLLGKQSSNAARLVH